MDFEIGGDGVDINLLVKQMLEDKKAEKAVYNACKNNVDDYFYDHYDGEIAEPILYAYCQRAKKNKYAREVLKQVVRYCDSSSLSARILAELDNLPQRDLETCCHYLAHCQLSFLQQFAVFLKCRPSEALIDLLECVCLQDQYGFDDVRYLMSYAAEDSIEVVRYFVETFDRSKDSYTTKKVEAVYEILNNQHGSK